MIAYHWEQDGKAACGKKKVDGLHLVDRAVRADCPRCLKLAKLEPLPVAVAVMPPRETVLKNLLELLCEAKPEDRKGLCEEALRTIGGTK
jgi:hypothetical protein